MFLQRFLHFVAALLLVMGMFAVTDSSASAVTRATPFAAIQPAAHTRTVAASTGNGVRGNAPLAAPSPSLRREVFGFGLASSLGDPTVGYPSWNFSLLSTVAFFGLHINWDGTIVSDSGLNVWNSSTLTGLLSTAHAGGTKVVLTVVLQDFAPGTPNMCAGLINRSVTVQQVVAEVTAKGVDGLNVDYEGLNGTCQNGQTAQAMMTDFVGQLRGALPSGSYLSVDTYASSAADSLGFYDIPGLNAYADSFFVMAYDLEHSNYRYPPLNCASFCLGPTAPLAGYHYNDTTTASQYAAAVPASKVILGVPYYGRKSCVADAVPNAYPSGSVTADSYLDASTESSAPGVSSFATHRDANDPNGPGRWDTWFNSSMNCTRELYWDDAASLGAKYDLVNADNLRGVGIWTLNYGGGAPELWSALSDHFAGCKAVNVTASSSPAVIGTTITLNATASGCPNRNPLFQFWILVPGGTAYQLGQAYSTNAELRWDTTGATAGTYVVSTWVRDASSTGTYGNQIGRWDAYSSIQVAMVAIPCSSVAASFAPPSPGTPGVPVTTNAQVTRCPHPLYQFWILQPGGTSFQLAQAYSTSATFQWSTTGKPTGTYMFSIWVRDAGSTGAYGNASGRWDAYSSSQYVLNSSCSAVSVSFAPASPNPIGTQASATAHATGCANPLYQFWILSPGGTTYQLAQAYSTTATVKWDTTGATAGTYVVSTWVRDASSTGTNGNQIGRWDAYDSSTYTLQGSPCSSVGVTFVPSSTTAGTPVTVTAQAAGCSHPLYQFWILSPGGSAYQLAQAYSTSATLKWDTTVAAAGAYVVSTWVRDVASTGTYANQLGRWDAYNSSSYTLQSSSCSSTGVSFVPASSTTAGTLTTVTAQATGCPHPLYQFWILSPGGSAYQLAQAYSTSATLKWDTTGAAAGAYVVSTWVRDAASTGTYGNQLGRWDAYNSSSYMVVEPCSAVSVTSSPSSTTSAGNKVTFNVASTACAHPLYEFWILTPGGSSYQLVRGYSSSATFMWSTGGHAPGAYQISIWARDAGSTGINGNQLGRWDAYNSSQYTLS